MTTHNDLDRASPEFDRLMTAWFDAEARVREPDDLLDRTISRTARIRPRSAWLLPERWHLVELTMQRVRVPRAARYAAVLAVLILLAALAFAIVGSQRRVPAPFGPAANGRIAIVTPGGDIATVDPATGVTTTIVGGPESDRYPVFSLDGTRIAFVRSVADGDAVFVVDASGGTPIRVTPEALGPAGLLAWSPDGSRIAFHSLANLWIARTDGSGTKRVALGFPIADEIEWRPPAGEELIVRGIQDGKAGLFLVKPDGSAVHPVTPVDGAEFDYLWVTWSPDGRRVAYHRHPAQEIHVLTIGQDPATVLEPEGGLDLMFPRFSPDGTRLAFMVWHPDHSQQIGVAPTDDPTPTVTLTGPTFPGAIQFDWSPDGTKILAIGSDTDEPWILDPAGGAGVRAAWRATFPDWVEWQRLAR